VLSAARGVSLPAADVLRVLRRDQRGSSSPVVVETAEGQWLVKLRGAAQGISPGTPVKLASAR